MNIIKKYEFILLIVPIILFLFYAWFMGYIPKSSILNKILNIVAEKDLGELLKKNGFNKTTVIAYQYLRLLFGIIFGLFVLLIMDSTKTKYAFFFITIIVVFKLLYVFLLYLDKARIKKLNQELPYMIKSLTYLAYTYPVINAIEKAINNVSTIFKYDLEILFKDINEDPITYKPYQNFIDRYNGKLNNLDQYLKILYRMSTSAKKEESKLLTSLNETISAEVSQIRKQKNDAVNMRISYLGMIPVFLLGLMLVYMLIVVASSSF